MSAVAGQRPGEEPAGRGQVPTFAGKHVDDLAELVDCPVQVGPSADDYDVHLIGELSIPRQVATRPDGVHQKRLNAAPSVTASTTMPRSASSSSTSR